MERVGEKYKRSQVCKLRKTIFVACVGSKTIGVVNTVKLAISNIGWTAEQDKEVYARMCELGYTGLEIAPTRILSERPYDRIEEAVAWYERLYARYGFEIPSMQSIWYGRTERIFGMQEERTELLEYTKRAIQFAAAIGCKNLVFGCPRNRALPEDAKAESAVSFFRELGEYAYAHNTVIGLEANPPIYHTNFINTTEQALDWINRIGSPGLQLNLDVGTMLYGDEPAALLKGRVGVISHVHISEPMLAPVRSRPLHRELAEVLRKENYDSYISIEMDRTDNLSQFFAAMEYVTELFRP